MRYNTAALQRILLSSSSNSLRTTALRSAGSSHALHQHNTVRCHWQMVLSRYQDKQTGKLKYQDWDTLVHQFQEPTKEIASPDGGSSGRNRAVSLLQRHLAQEEHIKPTEIKRRIQQKQTYTRSVKQLEDLTRYIQFVRQQDEKEE